MKMKTLVEVAVKMKESKYVLIAFKIEYLLKTFFTTQARTEKLKTKVLIS